VAENQSGGLSRLAAGLAAFAAGWVVMSLQLLGGRLMAPSFGQTIHQWGALIGATLAAMTLGYWLASRWGARALPGLLAVGALWAGLTPWLGREVCAWTEQALGPVAGSLAAAFVLMGPPGFALAAVSPLCVALLARGGSVAGASGLVSALGALGSIGGTFYGAFLAIPLLGLAGGYASAAVLAAAAAVAAGLAWRHVVLALVPLVPAVMAQRDFAADFLELRETPYNTIMVSQVPGGLVLALNSPHVMQSLRRHDGGPTGYYWDVLAAVPALARGHSALFLGVAGGTAVEQTLHAWPGLQAVGVEIAPAVIEVARRRFGLSIPVVAADARRFVAEPGPRFDVIVIDLYATGQIPAHVATREFYEAVARRLAPGGVVALNVYGAGDPATVVGPVAATLAAVFPGVLAADAGGGNVILLAWAEAMDLATARSLLAVVPLPAAERLRTALALPDPGWERVVLTDDRSDLEIRAAKALARK
jgi:SAM-dependent methyltransferase